MSIWDPCESQIWVCTPGSQSSLAEQLQIFILWLCFHTNAVALRMSRTRRIRLIGKTLPVPSLLRCRRRGQGIIPWPCAAPWLGNECGP